jgi:hypothetical protein
MLKTTESKLILIHGTVEGTNAKRTWVFLKKLLENSRNMLKIQVLA